MTIVDTRPGHKLAVASMRELERSSSTPRALDQALHDLQQCLESENRGAGGCDGSRRAADEAPQSPPRGDGRLWRAVVRVTRHALLRERPYTEHARDGKPSRRAIPPPQPELHGERRTHLKHRVEARWHFSVCDPFEELGQR